MRSKCTLLGANLIGDEDDVMEFIAKIGLVCNDDESTYGTVSPPATAATTTVNNSSRNSNKENRLRIAKCKPFVSNAWIKKKYASGGSSGVTIHRTREPNVVVQRTKKKKYVAPHKRNKNPIDLFKEDNEATTTTASQGEKKGDTATSVKRKKKSDTIDWMLYETLTIACIYTGEED